MSRVRIERDGAVGRIVLARPDRANVLDRAAADELFDALQELERDGAIRVVHLSADGDDFSLGTDLAAVARLLEQDADAQRADAEAIGRVHLALRAMMKPVVCTVRGRALSAGASLALACDIVLAHSDAEFGFPEVRIGFVAAMALPGLRRAVGEKHAADLVLTGRIIDAEEAERIGLVSRVLSAASWPDEVDGVLAGLAKQSPTALALTKWLHYKADGLTFEDGIAAGVVTNVEARSTEDFRAALRRLNDPDES